MRQFDNGAHQEAFAVLASAIRDLRETENMWLSITVCRHFVTMMSRLDRRRDTARIMGFYQSAMDSGQSSPLTPEAQSYIDSRMDPELQRDLAHGANLSTLEALDYMLAVFEELQR